MNLSRPSAPVRLIQKLPIARFQALRLWNRVQRLRGEVLVDTYFGARMLTDSREIIQASIAHFGIWEPEASELFAELIQEGDTVIDIGANIGYFSLLFAQAVGPAGRVISIEAMPGLAARIAHHAGINGIANIRVANVAVTDRPCRVSLYVPPDGNNGATTIRDDKGYTKTADIDGLPLADILTADERNATTFIKCDIEGAEGAVMNDVLSNIDRYPKLRVVAVEANTQEVPAWNAIFAEFVANGFKAYILPNNIKEAWLRMLDGKAPGQRFPIDALSETCSDLVFIR